MYEYSVKHEGFVIRPPSEAGSIILQITLGCSDNKCSFCPAFKDKIFKVRPLKDVEKEIKYYSSIYPDVRRIFFADGDGLCLQYKQLKNIFDLACFYFKKLSRISIYGSAKNIETKTVEELKSLKESKLSVVYMGFESGDDEIYKSTFKYGSPLLNAKGCLKLKDAGIKVNVTVISGLGGQKLSLNHSLNTAKILNLAKPEQIAVLSLMIAENTPLYQDYLKGYFKPLDKWGIIKELSVMIENLDDFKCSFFANHASNFLPLTGRFPKDKPAIIKIFNNVIDTKDEAFFVSDTFRSL